MDGKSHDSKLRHISMAVWNGWTSAGFELTTSFLEFVLRRQCVICISVHHVCLMRRSMFVDNIPTPPSRMRRSCASPPVGRIDFPLMANGDYVIRVSAVVSPLIAECLRRGRCSRQLLLSSSSSTPLFTKTNVACVVYCRLPTFSHWRSTWLGCRTAYQTFGYRLAKQQNRSKEKVSKKKIRKTKTRRIRKRKEGRTNKTSVRRNR